MESHSKEITLTEEQLDDLLKKWQKKGSDRALKFAFFGSFPLAILGGFVFGGMTPTAVLMSCAVYYCCLAFLAEATQ